MVKRGRSKAEKRGKKEREDERHEERLWWKR